MAPRNNSVIVFVACGTPAEARRIARSAVQKRLAACGNMSSGRITSIYRWKGKVEHARETLLMLKSTLSAFLGLEAEIRRLHSYEVPEIVALPIVAGSAPYLEWIGENVGKAKKGTPKSVRTPRQAQ
jgi:periplasmic divalent cation tolerance protein